MSVEWLDTDTIRYTEPFFEQTLRRLRRLESNRTGGARYTPAATLVSRGNDVEPTAFVFHASRCGSTLVCQMLASLDDSVVVSEAPVIDDILRAHRRDPSIDDRQRTAWLRGAVTALCQPGAERPRRRVVKLDAWHIFELDLIRAAFPGVPFVFVYRNPLEILVSIANMPSLAVVRDTITPAQLGISPAERDALTPTELAAAAVGAYYRAATSHRAVLAPMSYSDMPGVVWRELPGPRFSPGDVERMRVAAARDAKEPSQRFTPDAEAKARSASPEVRRACARWTGGAYAAWLDAVERAR